MTSLVVYVLSRLQSCWSCLEPLVPEETREKVERRHVLMRGATFAKRSFTLGGFSLRSQVRYGGSIDSSRPLAERPCLGWQACVCVSKSSCPSRAPPPRPQQVYVHVKEEDDRLALVWRYVLCRDDVRGEGVVVLFIRCRLICQRSMVSASTHTQPRRRPTRPRDQRGGHQDHRP